MVFVADPDKDEGPIPMASRMQGIWATVDIKGRGTVKWTVTDDSGTSRVIRSPEYYVRPQAYSTCKILIALALRSISSHMAMQRRSLPCVPVDILPMQVYFSAKPEPRPRTEGPPQVAYAPRTPRF
jgi:hypothetical protein